MKQTYLMLAHVFKAGKQSIAGWFLSEKLDGIRAFWDGGLSCGLKASEVPYANTVKDFRLKHEVIATGLWSRTGKVIYAPDYWLDELPLIPLDGELWIGPHSFQELTSVVSTKDNSKDIDWDKVKFMVFDSPPPLKMFADRRVTVRDYDFGIEGAMRWYLDGNSVKSASVKWNFEMVQDWLGRYLYGSVAKLLPQERLPFNYHKAMERIDKVLELFIREGAEGIMLRKAESFWVTNRSHMLLKHKPYQYGEATITGFTSGKETEKGSRLLGMIGALIVNYQGKRLELSGLTDEKRQFNSLEAIRWAKDYPGKDMPTVLTRSLHFYIGQMVMFKYRELSDDGVPKEARYYRKIVSEPMC